jgi:hypothetical protein
MAPEEWFVKCFVNGLRHDLQFSAHHTLEHAILSPGNAMVVYLNDYRMHPQAHGYIIVAFHLESIWVSLFIFSRRMAWCKSVY